MSERPQWHHRPHRRGHHARVVIPRGGYLTPITVGAVGGSPAEAVHRAALVAQQIASNPVLAAVLPPGTGVALGKIVSLSGAIRAGRGRQMLAQMAGPGARRLFHSLTRGFHFTVR